MGAYSCPVAPSKGSRVARLSASCWVGYPCAGENLAFFVDDGFCSPDTRHLTSGDCTHFSMADGDDIGEGSEPDLEGDFGVDDELGVDDDAALPGGMEFGDDAESALDDPDGMDAGDGGAFPDELEFDDAEGAFPDDFDLGDDGLEDVVWSEGAPVW